MANKALITGLCLFLFFGLASAVSDTCVDGGNDFYEQDVVTITYASGGTATSEDACVSDEKVQEITCVDSEDYPGSKNFGASYFDCPYGCENGACRKYPEVVCGDGVCSKGEACSSCSQDCGTCPKYDKCSDGGDDFYEKDVVTITYASGGIATSSDTCLSDGRVQEINCVDSEDYPGSKNFGASYFDCPYGCENGACLEYTEKVTCKDSDGGKELYTAGWISLSGDPDGVLREDDNCVSEYYLHEKYCSNGMKATVKYKCTYGCEDGACKKATPSVLCKDTDGGKDYTTQGTVRFSGYSSYVPDVPGGDTYTDKCSGLTSVNEFYCDGNTLKAVSYACSSGQKCKDGACYSPVVCGDAVCSSGETCSTCPKDCGSCTKYDKCYDGGDDFYTKDVATITYASGGTATSEDACLSDGRVQEITCVDSEDYIGSKNFGAKYLQCPNGCEDGACLPETVERGCGDGVCDRVTCAAVDCVPPETCESCPEDCGMCGTTGTIEIPLEQGWNLIAFPGKGTLSGGTCANTEEPYAFVYLQDEGTYVTLSEATDLMGSEALKEYLRLHSFWIYSFSKCSMKFVADSKTSYSEISAVEGWNFLPVTSDMVGKSLDDIRGDCEFEKAHYWNAAGQTWSSVPMGRVFQNSAKYNGFIAKADSDCAFGTGGGGGITPPPLPF